MMTTSVNVMSAMRRLVMVGLREEAVETSRTMRLRTAGILDGVTFLFVLVMSVGVEV